MTLRASLTNFATPATTLCQHLGHHEECVCRTFLPSRRRLRHRSLHIVSGLPLRRLLRLLFLGVSGVSSTSTDGRQGQKINFELDELKFLSESKWEPSTHVPLLQSHLDETNTLSGTPLWTPLDVSLQVLR